MNKQVTAVKAVFKSTFITVVESDQRDGKLACHSGLPLFQQDFDVLEKPMLPPPVV